MSVLRLNYSWNIIKMCRGGFKGKRDILTFKLSYLETMNLKKMFDLKYSLKILIYVIIFQI